MITFFTLPKPFTGLAKIQQTNAIKSWTLLEPTPEIILFGEEEGIAECAEELGVTHVPDLNYNEYGTPLLNSAFDYVEEHAKYDYLCYINADIILLPGFDGPLRKVQFRKFLMVGHRWNIEQNTLVDFTIGNWHQQLISEALETNKSSNTGGSDYFLYKKGCIRNFPPFAVGRPVWDNWMIYYFRKNGFPVLDASKVLHVIHQNHEYQHVKSSNGDKYWGMEANENVKLYGSEHDWFSLEDVSHFFLEKDIIQASLKDHFLKRPAQFRVAHPVRFQKYNALKMIRHFYTRIKINIGKLVR